MSNAVVVAQPPLQERLDRLPRFYSYKDILDLFDGDEDRFLDAYCGGVLPPEVQAIILETATIERMTVWLLRRQVRLLNELVRLAGEPLEFRPNQ